MRPPGNPTGGGSADRSDSRDELQQEPITQNDESRDGEKEDYDEGKHPRSRIKDDIRTHDAGNGAAGAESGNGGVEIEDDVAQVRANSANEIEEKIGEMAEVILNVVAEDPEEEHVSADMEKAAVEEHAGQDGEKRGAKSDVAVEEGGDSCRDGGIGEHEGMVLVWGQG